MIALIVTPDGFPLAYKVMDGNTSDKTTLKEFLAKIEKQYGRAKRTWVMEYGIPTEEVLAEMLNSETPIHYLVGSPRGTPHAAREGVSDQAMGGCARERAGQADRTRGRDISSGFAAKAGATRARWMRRRRLKKLMQGGWGNCNNKI